MGQPGSVHGIILAGTYPTGKSRLEDVLKGPLAPVAQRPLVSYALRWLKDAGIPDATICVNDATRRVRAAFGDGSALAMRLQYHEDPVPRGPAGCVRDAGLCAGAETFVVAEGALIPTLDMQELLDVHRRAGAVLTVVVDQDRRRRMGGERPPSPAGIYVFNIKAFDWIPALGFQDIKEALIPRLYRAGVRVQLHVVPGVSVRIHSQESYLAVNEWMVQRVVAPSGVLEGSYFRRCGGRHSELLVHCSAHTAPDVRVMGPVVLGPGVRVLSGATLVGPVSVGAGSTVGEGALVSRSVVWERCVIGAEAVVDRGLLTDDAVVEPGLMLFNTVRRRPRHPVWLGRLASSADEREPVSLLEQPVQRRPIV